MSNETIYNIYFKKVYSHMGIQIEIPGSIMMTELNDFIKPIIFRTYGLNNYVIIEAGKPLGENDMPIDETEEITFHDKYYLNKSIGFYVRPTTIVCPGCVHNIAYSLSVQLYCGHNHCQTCISNLQQSVNNTCYMCRRSIEIR
jgi:hypothetical protein